MRVLIAPLISILLLSGTAALAQMQTIGLDETFAAGKLPAAEAREIITGVEKSAYDTPESWEKELRVRRVDLGSGPGIVVRGTNLLCGATGNCQMWVFRRVNGRWLSLFDINDAPIADGFQLGPMVTRGIKDLVVTANVSAERGSRTTYQFDGSVYRAR